MLWFDLWLSTANRSYLEASIRYNEENGRATKAARQAGGDALAAMPTAQCPRTWGLLAAMRNYPSSSGFHWCSGSGTKFTKALL